jgi:hypothetical protein
MHSKKDRQNPEIIQLKVNDVLLPARLTPTELLSAIFECFWNPGIEHRSITNLKMLYCNMLELVADVCKNNREYKKGTDKSRCTYFITTSLKKRVRVSKIVRYLEQDEKRCRIYLLTTIYNEILKGYKDD